MTPVDQTISTAKYGDCQRACVATLFDLPIEAVPHFMCFDDDTWPYVFAHFVYAIGYDCYGTAKFKHGPPDKTYSIDGLTTAAVPSTFKGMMHAVVIDMTGLVVHDPSLRKQHQGVNVIETGELTEWDMLGPRGLPLPSVR